MPQWHALWQAEHVCGQGIMPEGQFRLGSLKNKESTLARATSGYGGIWECGGKKVKCFIRS